ncbi:ribonuclease R [Paenibacillus sp. CAU 1523]|uniref:Ribonuclease R n=1 Tax=Paenibacillus arenosi TaxID=2774142 RepID=A0ABR9B1S9_9BACL|nr:ribonuclease R [Paenibacillus arenosi]
MITAQQILEFMQETAYRPMTYQELEKHFEIEDAQEFKAFLKTLNELEHSGHIIRTRTDRYGVPERMNLLRGRLQAHAKGFGFLIPEETGHPDVYIHANDLQSAMNGDTILVRVTNKGHDGARLEGEIVRIVKRAVEQVVGVFQNHESFGFVVPDDRRINRDIFIAREAMAGAVSGQKVVVRIVSYPEGRTAAQGEVIEVLGHKNDPGVDILSVIRKHQLPEAFPDEVMAEAEAVPDSISDEEIISQGRRDLRGFNIVTIDGEDAKDLDDAVYVEQLENGNYKLGVHIADVGYYVQEGSALDREAYARGCSVYLVDRVIPMLPHRLSNGICSLHPHVDRLTLSCEMEFDAQAKVVRHDVFPSVIRSVERMTYNNVRKIVEDQDPELCERYSYLVDNFMLMKELAMKLRGKRMRRGAIDFDFQESKVIVDEEGKAVDIVKRERSIAEQIIEEFMLAANETVAEHFHWLRVPFLYRIHEDPDSEKLLTFMSFAANFGYAVRGKGNSVHPRALQSLLEEIQGTREQTVISTMMLRSMRQAKYDAESTGHFGLAAEFYSHFTSPIRRYPDLVIHRIIREVADNGGSLTQKRHELLHARMPDVAQQSSERERVAVDAERDTEQLKKAEFMLDKVGEEFDGIISSVTNFGMFIELENTVEGLIRLSDLSDDYYHFHEQHMMLLGERTARMFRIGDQIRIVVANVNMEDHTIDFALVGQAQRFGSGRQGREFGFERKKRGRSDSRDAGRGGRDAGRSGQGARGDRAGSGGQGGRGGDARSGHSSRGNEASRSAGRDGRRGQDGGANVGRGDRRDAGRGGQGVRGDRTGSGGQGGRGGDTRGGAARDGRRGRDGGVYGGGRGGQGQGQGGRNERFGRGDDTRGGKGHRDRNDGRDGRLHDYNASNGREDGHGASELDNQGVRFMYSGASSQQSGLGRDAGRRHGYQDGFDDAWGSSNQNGSQHEHEEGGARRDEEVWYNQGEWRERNKRGRNRRDRGESNINPYARPSQRQRGQGGITFGSNEAGARENGRKERTEANNDANWVDRLVKNAERESGGNRFDFGSGKGGYGRSRGSSSTGQEGGRDSGFDRGGDYRSGRGQLGGGKRGRRSISESGVFVGEDSPQAARNRSGDAEQAAHKRGKSKNNTAKFVRKKR